MYKRPPKHIQRIQLTILYTIMTVAVLGFVTFLVFVVANYGYNQKTGTFEQRGLVQFASIPSGASVKIDGNQLAARTATKSSVAPGSHVFEVQRAGYQPWTLETHIPQGSLVWLNYIRLVPEDRPVEKIHHYEQFVSALPAPSKRSILVQTSLDATTLRLIDIAGDTPKGEDVTLPDTIVRRTSDEIKKKVTVRYELDSWDESGRFVSMWRIAGKSRELIVLNTEDAKKSVNVSRTLSVIIEDAIFSGRSGKVLYAKIDGDIRKLDMAGGTISRSLVGQVAHYTLQGDTVITYVSQPDRSTGTREVGVYREGDEVPIVLRTVTREKVPVSIASYRYYGTVYTVMTEGKDFYLYKGHYDHGMEGLQLVASRTFTHDVESAEFNATGSHVLLRSNKAFASYGIDRNLFTHTTLSGNVSTEDFFWIDAMHLGLTTDQVVTMRNIDGTNSTELNAVGQSTVPAVLSRNGTYLYSFSSSKDGEADFQRIRMILK